MQEKSKVQVLGIEIDIYDQQGNSIFNDEKGELVVKKPFPSMPTMFGMILMSQKLCLHI